MKAGIRRDDAPPWIGGIHFCHGDDVSASSADKICIAGFRRPESMRLAVRMQSHFGSPRWRHFSPPPLETLFRIRSEPRPPPPTKTEEPNHDHVLVRFAHHGLGCEAWADPRDPTLERTSPLGDVGKLSPGERCAVRMSRPIRADPSPSPVALASFPETGARVRIQTPRIHCQPALAIPRRCLLC